MFASASGITNLGSLTASVVSSPTTLRHAQCFPLPEPWRCPSKFNLTTTTTTTTTTTSSSWRTTTSVKTAVAVVNSSDPVEKQAECKKRYYFVIANAKFMLDEEEHFQEQLFERRRLFEERKMEQDFWLVVEPKFLDKFPDITKRLKRPAVALVSTNGTWIKFMKLRLDRVLLESFEADSVEEALASTPVKLEFEKPEKWVAPYPKYESGWWEPFLFSTTEKQAVS